MRHPQLTYYEAKAKRNRHRHVWRLLRTALPFAVIGGLVFAPYLFPEKIEPMLSRGRAQDRSGEAYYPNCAAARAAGVAPISIGDPGYRAALDGDDDGIACEPYRREP